MPVSDDSASSPARTYAPYAQLVKMLLPSAGSVAIYDCAAELVWCSDGYERPDLRRLLEEQRISDTLAARGRVENTVAGVPVFISQLRATDARPLGSVVIELGSGSFRSTPSMVVSMLRPVLDCLERQLDLEGSTSVADRSAGFDLLLGVDEHDRLDAGALQELLSHCVRQLNCVTGALLVPDKNTEISCTVEEGSERSQLLDRTQKHLLAWVQLNNRPMVVNRGAGGADAPYKILSCPLRDPTGRVIGLVALFRANSVEDFEQRDVRILEFVGRKAVAILESEHDSLTGLTNRFIFERRAQKVLDQASAAGVALLYVDIDKIAAINEAFGLCAGDEVIQRVASIARQAAGMAGLVSRIAADRFAIMLPADTMAAASDVGKRILAAASQFGYVHGTETLPVSVSIGVVMGKAGERLAHVLAAAELACKRAKRDGAGRVVAIEDVAGELAPVPTRQLLAATDLQEALRSNQFQLDAQPIVGLRARTGQVVGYELLVRLRNSAGECLAPDKFLSACAHYGLLPALDRWAVCSAVETLRPHAQALASSAPFFSLNVSVQSLENRKYLTFALETLAAAGLSPALVCFELKEAEAVANLGAAEAFIRAVTEAGAKVALDDFGSGLSSLVYLKRLPVSYLKIDGRFVRRMTTDRIAESIVSGIARAAHTLGVLTIAEHVESAAVADRLRELEVTLGQGFHLGRPAPFGQVVAQAVPAAATVTQLTTRG